MWVAGGGHAHQERKTEAKLGENMIRYTESVRHKSYTGQEHDNKRVSSFHGIKANLNSTLWR